MTISSPRKMSPERKREVQDIFSRNIRKLAKAGRGNDPRLTSLHPYNAETSHNPEAKGFRGYKNYLAELILQGKRPTQLPSHVLFKNVNPSKFNAEKVWQKSDLTYYSPEERQQFLVTPHDDGKGGKIWKDAQGKPVSGPFIYGVDPQGNTFFLPRIDEEKMLSEAKYKDLGLPELIKLYEEKGLCEKNTENMYPVVQTNAHSAILSGTAGICFGNVTVQEGKVTHWDNNSGHYRPLKEHMQYMLEKTEIGETLTPDATITITTRGGLQGITKENVSLEELKNYRPT